MTANVPNRSQEPIIQMRNPRPRVHPRYVRNSSCSTTNPAFEIQLHGNQQPRNLNFTQQQINAALFNNSIPQYSVQPIVRQSTKSPHSFENMGFSVVPQQHQHLHHHHQPSAIVAPSSSRNPQEDLHMAERLVLQQCAQKSAFKFDTINNQSSSGRSKATVVAIGSGNPVAGSSIKELATMVETTAEIAPIPVSEKRRSRGDECGSSGAVKTLESSSDDNGGFVTPPDEQQHQQSSNSQQSKIPKPPAPSKHNKPTVVGNPMFANTPDSELGPGESLGLDDLDMDYEQIMHYFDNLKESNA